MSNPKFCVATLTRTERGDILRNKPTPYDECVGILTDNGWTKEGAEEVLSTLVRDNNYIEVVSGVYIHNRELFDWLF